jgi:pyridoxine kinase
MAILSIQSHVASGHVGNRAAVFALETLGHDVCAVNTVELSSHPGHAESFGGAVPPTRVAEVLDGLRQQGAFARAPAVLTGYLGCVATARLALDAVRAIKEARADALYLCDPVIGDAREGLYVPDELARWIKAEAVPRADILTPNAFELAYLSGRPTGCETEGLVAAHTLAGQGGRVVVATSLAPDREKSDRKRRQADALADASHGAAIVTIAVVGTRAWRVTTPRLATRAKGAGDLLAALFLGHYLVDRDAGRALATSVSTVHCVLAAAEAGQEEAALDLPLVAGRTAITRPWARFVAEQIS